MFLVWMIFSSNNPENMVIGPVLMSLYFPAPLNFPKVYWKRVFQEAFLFQIRGINSYLKLGGQLVIRRVAAAAAAALLFCQNLGGQLPTLPTHYWHPGFGRIVMNLFCNICLSSIMRLFFVKFPLWPSWVFFLYLHYEQNVQILSKKLWGLLTF